MKTALLTTSYLIPKERYDKSIKFFNYYFNQVQVPWEIYFLDNASPIEELFEFCKDVNSPFVATVLACETHYDRPTHLDYKYLWRAVYRIQTLFKQGFDKVVYMDNDLYLLSPKIFKFIESIDEGWHTFYCKKHNFPETGIHIIHKNNKSYNNFVKGPTEEEFINKYNLKCMETTLPIENIHKEFNGDRWSEYGIAVQNPLWDFSAQTPLDMIIKNNE